MPMTVTPLCPATLGIDPESGCAFVLEPPRDSAGMRFCEAPRRPGSAYCSVHHASCHVAAGSSAERLRLREIEALARAVGGKSGGAAARPSLRALHRLDRTVRAFLRPDRSLNVLNDEDVIDAADR